MSYLEVLCKDEQLRLIISSPLPPLQKHQNVAIRLMASIMGQQLSTRVAKVIFKRFLELYGGEEPAADDVLNTESEVLRGIGLSNAKVNYVKNVALFCKENHITDQKLALMTDREVVTTLTAIKGVGTWTVEMLLMFSLGREDVFSPGDLGIQQAMISLYGLQHENRKTLWEKMEKIAENWKPYRSFACMHLWKWKDAQ